MQRVTMIIRRGLLYLTALVLVAGYPVAAMAETQEPVTEPVTETQTTEATLPPEPELTYTYDPATEKWNSEKWQFNPITGTYEPTPTPVVIEPESITDESDASLDKTVDTNVDITNTIDSNAASGDSSVIGNTSAGSATTGDAEAIATLMNVVNSTVTAGDNEKVATFTQDIYGDVTGDIILYPLLLKAMLEAQVNPTPNTTLDATSNFNVDNTLNLTATSGDATVSQNTSAGDATTGSATAVANVVNILNSMIAAQDSFIGTINIYGNLEGDILVAPDFIPQMIANNAESGDETSATQLSSEATTNIVNDISAVAESGAASVFGNTSAGSATSGDADTNVVIFNLSGHEIIAKNSLLVFVNVLGKWVGVIVDAPEGANAALIGNEVTKNTQYAPDLTVNSQSTHGITNTIALNAESGDATVSSNTSAGNAISGQAKAMANVANISGSQFGMTDWFGVLFINVFQNWYGSFGVNTAYGDGEKATGAPAPTGPVQFIPASSESDQTNLRYTVIDTRTVRATEAVLDVDNSEAVLASMGVTASQPDEIVKPLKQETEEPQDYRIWIVAGSLFVIGLSAIGLRRLLQA